MIRVSPSLVLSTVSYEMLYILHVHLHITYTCIFATFPSAYKVSIHAQPYTNKNTYFPETRLDTLSSTRQHGLFVMWYPTVSHYHNQ